MSKNITQADLILQRIIVEVRYEKGYRFLDKTGEVLIEIEERLDDWLPEEIRPTGGHINKPGKELSADFDSYRLSITQQKVLNASEIIVDSAKLLDILIRHLKIENFLRVGCRTYLHYPCESLEEASRKLIDLGIIKPKNIMTGLFEGELTSGQVVYTYEKEKEIWRIGIQPIEQYSSGRIDKRILVDPKSMPSKQKAIRPILMKFMEQQKFEHTFAIEVDIDRGTKKVIKANEFDIRLWLNETIQFTQNSALKILNGDRDNDC